jgi:adenylylsulfate kinase
VRRSGSPACGVGKSTLAFAVEAALLARGRPAYVLDGDNVRRACAPTGLRRGRPPENVRRVAEVARLFADAGTVRSSR